MKKKISITVDVENDYWNEQKSSGIVQGIPLILNMLQRIGASGTFFWTASMAKKYPEIVQTVVNNGHEIGCHGVNHENMVILDKTQQYRVLRKAVAIFNEIGISCKGFRAPRLRINESLFSVLQDTGFSYDSSIPFWGIRRYKYGNRFDNPVINELKCIPSYAFRLNKFVLSNALSRSQNSLGYSVFFLHPWEIIVRQEDIKQLTWKKKLIAINWMNTGVSFIDNLEHYFMDKKGEYRFLTCSQLANNLKEKK